MMRQLRVKIGAMRFGLRKMDQILRNSDTQNVIEGFGRNIDNTDSFIREIQEDDFFNCLFEVID